MKTTTAKVNNKAKSALEKGKKIAKNTGKSISDNPKQAIYIVGGVLAIYLIYRAFKGIKSGADAVSDFFTGDSIQNNIDVGNSVIPNPTQTTITNNQAILHASALLEAMNYSGWTLWGYHHGTDEAVIEQIFDNINSEDFKAIYRAFGKKHYNGFGSSQDNIGGSIESAIGLSEERDLVYWLRAELNSFFDKGVFQKVKAIVEGAGFTFV